MELCDCTLDSGVDLKLFSVIAAFSQRVAVLEYVFVSFCLVFFHEFYSFTLSVHV